MNCGEQYAIWDILDDLVFRKIAESDCSAFARLYPCEFFNCVPLYSF